MSERVYLFKRFERFWHWSQAALIVFMLATGFEIHGSYTAIGFERAVQWHTIAAWTLAGLWLFAIFWHLTTGEWKQYIPTTDKLVAVAHFYAVGIFKGEPHPFEKRPDDRMNPLQKVTYFGILNVLLPLQIVTGALMWGAQKWPEVAGALGGLPLLGPFHSLVAWVFAAFILMHVYLTTTGATPLEAIRGMVTGYEEVETHGPAAADDTKAPAAAT